MSRARLLTGAGLVATLFLTGCGTATQAPPPRRPVTSYVAVGDTFAAAPLIDTTAQAKGCRRSESNYPSQVAALLKITDVTDVTCDEATPDAVRKKQKTRSGRKVAPQLEAVTSSTQLVTLSLGAYQNAMFSLIAKACGKKGTPCLMANYQTALDNLLLPVRSEIASDIRAISAKAPDAIVMVVGYPRHVERKVPKGEKKSCKGLPELRKVDRLAWSEVDNALNLSLARAARDTGAEYVDVFDASQGHGLCSADPWILGASPKKHTGIPFGPSAAGQKATARLVRDALASAQ